MARGSSVIDRGSATAAADPDRATARIRGVHGPGLGRFSRRTGGVGRMASDRYPGLRLGILSAAVVAMAAAAAPAGAARGPGQPGSLDAGFGNQGKVVRTVGSESAGEGIVT